MVRYHHNVYASAKTPRFIVLFDLQWKIIECQRLEPCADLDRGMRTAIQRLSEEGWQPESAPTKTAGAVLNRLQAGPQGEGHDGPSKFGFVFLNRNGVRRLLILTERDPYDDRPQTFSPFK